MERFKRLTARAIPLPEANIDTDVIFPARFLLITAKRGLGRYAFHEWRYGPGGVVKPESPLNQARFKDAEILVAGDNFGCGSSREQAAWALKDLGVRCVISTRFGEIFEANCFKNGMLAVVVGHDDLVALLEDARAGLTLEIDLERLAVHRSCGVAIVFDLAPWRRDALLNGWDEIDMVLNHDQALIAAFEQRQRAAMPWLYQGD